MRQHLILMLALIVTACNGGGEAVEATDTPQPQDTAEDRAVTPDTVITEDTTADAGAGQDAAQDTAVPPDTNLGCQPGEGCFLDPCAQNGDCLSGWCVDHMGDPVCTVQCQEDCPAGWSCQLVAGSEPDAIFICVSDFTALCRPCAAGTDCQGGLGQQDVCVSYDEEGSFCGGACEKTDDCPWGFSCADVLTVDGVETRQCVADAGVCPCTDSSVELGLWTPCEMENEWGTCDGKRICTDQGLADCDAPEPAEETCNGLDDDCDGSTDEDTCDDDNACTEDSCTGEGGCVHTPLTGGECLDGNPCTIADHCVDGICEGTPVDCDDENPCTDDGCDETGGCVFTPNQADCDDLDPCTVSDQCEDSVCAGFPVDCDCLVDQDCADLEDGDLCNGTLICDTTKLPYTCRVAPETVITCPAPVGADAPCLVAACDPDTGACGQAAANDGAPCSDGDQCSLYDACDQGACVGGPALPCDDSNPCTDDACDPDAGCLHDNNTAACDDGNACTEDDGCLDGACTGTTVMCTDDNPCTDNSCDPNQGCVTALNEAPCDDKDLCTTGDHCHLGDCISSGSLPCNDGNPCTDDSCDPVAGCTFTANAEACDDGNECTVNDACSGGACAGDMLVCNDNDICTDDGCNPDTGCVFVHNQAPCDDGDFCTITDVCDGGACVGAGALPCDDGNPCTDDSCDPDLGCQYGDNIQPCSDDDECTVGDACAGGQCVPGPAANCDDGNECTTDTCAPDSGCANDAVPDFTACQGGAPFACVGGQCTCVPQCSGKECGPDQCGGVCGTCEGDEECNPDTGKCTDGGVIFGPYTWYLGPRGGTCIGVCEAHGMSCANINSHGWTESCSSNVCELFYPNLPCKNDGDGPRISATQANGTPSGSSYCVVHDWDWSGWSCGWVERADDVRICPCQ